MPSASDTATDTNPMAMVDPQDLVVAHDRAAYRHAIVQRLRRELRDGAPGLVVASEDDPLAMAIAIERVDATLADWEGEALGTMLRLRAQIGRRPPRRGCGDAL